MNHRIVMKLGGGLITDKSQLKTVHAERIHAISSVIQTLTNEGHEVIIIHGAGSYGHLLAKKWGLAGGADSERIEAQREAVEIVRSDMKELNSHVCASLEAHGLSTISHPPSEWVVGTGPDFEGDISRFNEIQTAIPTTFGDVVDCDDPIEFGILSGDDLMVRICCEVPGVSHCIFLLGDTPGLMTKPPSDPGSELIPIWSNANTVEGSHASEQDVTGGIFLKAESAALIAQKIPEVWLLDGRCPERIAELISTGSTYGTKVVC